MDWIRQRRGIAGYSIAWWEDLLALDHWRQLRATRAAKQALLCQGANSNPPWVVKWNDRPVERMWRVQRACLQRDMAMASGILWSYDIYRVLCKMYKLYQTWSSSLNFMFNWRCLMCFLRTSSLPFDSLWAAVEGGRLCTQHRAGTATVSQILICKVCWTCSYGYQIEFAGVDSYAMLGNSEFMCFHCFAFLILFRFHFCFSVVACVVAFALRSAFCVRLRLAAGPF